MDDREPAGGKHRWAESCLEQESPICPYSMESSPKNTRGRGPIFEGGDRQIARSKKSRQRFLEKPVGGFPPDILLACTWDSQCLVGIN